MVRRIVVPGALLILGTALLAHVCGAQRVAEFALGPPPAHAAASGAEHLDFTLDVRDAKITGARIYLAPLGKHRPSRRSWRYVGMVSFFPAGTNSHAMFDLPLHAPLLQQEEMIAEPIAPGKTAPDALRIVAASVATGDE
jgi:hypothetical protein